MGNACFTSFGKLDVKGIKLMCETHALQVWAKLTNTGMQGMGAAQGFSDVLLGTSPQAPTCRYMHEG